MSFFSFFFKPKLSSDEKKALDDLEKKNYIEKRKKQIEEKYR